MDERKEVNSNCCDDCFYFGKNDKYGIVGCFKGVWFNDPGRLSSDDNDKLVFSRPIECTHYKNIGS